MSEHPIPEVTEVTEVAEQSEETPVARKGGGIGRKLLTVALPAVLVLGAAGGGIAYTAVTVSDADRSAETIAWQKPAAKNEKAGDDPAAATLKGRADTPMSKLLLPAPSGFHLGPDIDSYGNDGELSGKEAAALLKNDARGLSGKKRRAYEKQIERFGVQGIGVRSFASDSDDLVVEVRIVRMKDRKWIADLHRVKGEIAGVLEFPKGPKIPGHRNSACYLMPDFDQERDGDKADPESDLGGMSCSAYDSDLLVSVVAYGSAPFEKSSVAELVKKQLDHIKSPGEYV
ncbi:hypothetical protein [Streptomyces sp. NPDC094032]|uniref:hypothetical protein n=1 Tax=Streptomyces sp. NPDC094032 TaxID=3155308 RepID=UPI00331D0822